MKYYLILISFVLYVNIFCIEDERFQHLTVEDGLSQSTIFSMIQDSRGFIWVGTYNGLNKFDGYNFTVFTPQATDSFSISSNGITALYEDSNGIIWVGTFDGFLNKYDRKNDKFYRYNLNVNTPDNLKREQNRFEIPVTLSLFVDETITSIAEDTSGVLWIGTWGNGLVKFKKSSGEVEHFYHSDFNTISVSSNSITKVLVDKKNNVWIGTYGGGVNKLVEKELLLSATQSTRTVSSYIFVPYTHSNENKSSLSDNRILTLYEDNQQNIWIGCYDGWLNKLVPDQKEKLAKDASFEKYFRAQDEYGNSVPIMTILEDFSGIIWVGSFGAGLYKFDITTGAIFNYKYDELKEESISANEVISLLEDNSGILWVGTHLGAGLSKLTKNEFKFGLLSKRGSPNKRLSDDVIWSIFEDSKENIWIGTYRSGLDQFIKSRGEIVNHKHDPNNLNSISGNHIKSVTEDNRGNLWIGTYENGLNFYDTKTRKFRSFKHIPRNHNSLSGNHIEDIFIDSKDNVWLGVFEHGINVFSLDHFYNTDQLVVKRYQHNPGDPLSLSSNKIYMIHEDVDGDIWIGAIQGGLCKYLPEKDAFQRFMHNPLDYKSISDDRVILIHEDCDHFLWVGTYGGGLNKFNKKKNEFTRFNSAHGLLSDVVYGILEDENHHLWMSTDAGIFMFDTKDETFIQYDLNDGLQSMEFSGGAYHKTRKGEMYFGGVNGVNYFYPDSIKRNAFVPPVVINKVMVFDEPLKGEVEEFELSNEQNVVSFEFSSLDFTNPKENQYAYILEGLEDVWNYTDASTRIAKYPGLLPGKYKFRVKGTNNTGIWNNLGTSVSFVIQPPFWLTWWFITFLILFLGGSVFLLVFLRIRHLVVIDKLKTKLAADLHDNIGAGLTEISILSELTAHEVGGKDHPASSKLDAISGTARELVESMSDIVWVVNPNRDSLHDLIIRLKDVYSELLSQVGISFRTNNVDKLQKISLPMDYRQNLYLIFKEGINNAVKHSNCTRILLEANLKKNILSITLKDDGDGIAKNRMAMGNGLRNMKDRAKSIKGNLVLDSKDGTGTKISFTGRLRSSPGVPSLFKKLGILQK